MNWETELQEYEAWLMSEEAEVLVMAYNGVYL